MSEEEVIQGINRTIAFMKEELKAEHSCFSIQELWALNGLLDLYNKEKEERQYEKELRLRYERRYNSKSEENKKLKEKNDILQTNYEILQGEMDRIGIDTLELEKGSSTDDVIEKIKELKKLESADLTTVYMNGFYDGEKKWKEKIKCRLHDTNNWLDGGRYTNYGLDSYNLTAVKEELEKLLEEKEE